VWVLTEAQIRAKRPCRGIVVEVRRRCTVWLTWSARWGGPPAPGSVEEMRSGVVIKERGSEGSWGCRR